MIQQINSSLRQVTRDWHRLRKLAIQAQSLERELEEARVHAASDAEVYAKESKDIDKISDPGIPRLWHFIRPQSQKRWNREIREYIEARRRYEASQFIVRDLEQQLLAIQQEAALLGDSEKIYVELLRIKEDYLRQTQHPEVSKLLEQEEKMAVGEAELKELEEADCAVNKTVESLKSLHHEILRLNRVRKPTQWMEKYYEHRIMTEARHVQHFMLAMQEELQDVLGKEFQLHPEKQYFVKTLLKIMEKAPFLEDQIQFSTSFIKESILSLRKMQERLYPLIDKAIRSINLSKQRMKQIVENV